MGANAQTAVPAFTAGQVLTAAQQTQINTGVPVFATTVTRDAAFGGTGEKTLAEGQFAYIEATNTTQYYDGAAWQAVGASGLTLISATTIGTTVSSVTVSDAFSATYDAYKITVTGGAGSTGNSLLMTLGATTTGYSLQIVYGAFNNTPLAIGTSNTSSWNAGNGNTNSLSMNVDLLNPFLTEQTFINGALIENGAGGALAGFLNNTTSYTAFTLTTSGGTITGGTIRVYGYANS